MYRHTSRELLFSEDEGSENERRKSKRKGNTSTVVRADTGGSINDSTGAQNKHNADEIYDDLNDLDQALHEEAYHHLEHELFINFITNINSPSSSSEHPKTNSRMDNDKEDQIHDPSLAAGVKGEGSDLRMGAGEAFQLSTADK